MSVPTYAELSEKNAGLEREAARLYMLVDMEWHRLIMYVRRLEDSVGRLRRFLRREGHERFAERTAEEILALFVYEDKVVRAKDKRMIAHLVSGAIRAGANTVSVAPWRPMPPLLNEGDMNHWRSKRRARIKQLKAKHDAQTARADAAEKERDEARMELALMLDREAAHLTPQDAARRAVAKLTGVAWLEELRETRAENLEWLACARQIANATTPEEQRRALARLDDMRLGNDVDRQQEQE